ncbi:RAD protein [Plasmodium ovale wallikeri]|uniref:RAD protein n=1 Tax=Plasmodium ovale wallikeri TaxID=864142 RepID=A0A1A9AL57_PLAOA|nr:RAD protein [Plasmodium ovale wallikeri]
MGKKKNFGKLNLTRINNVFSFKVNISSELQKCSIRTRLLTEFSTNENSIPGQNTLETNKINNIFIQKKSDPPFGCTETDLDKTLTKNELDDLIISYNSQLNEKEMYIIFYYHNQLMNESYKEMAKNLKDKLEKLGLENDISQNDLNKYMETMEKYLNSTLAKWNELSYKNIVSKIQNRKEAPKAFYKIYLYNCRMNWKKGMTKLQESWTENLMTVIQMK